VTAEAAVGAAGDGEVVAVCDVVEVTALIELLRGILVTGEGAATSWGSMANEGCPKVGAADVE